MPQDELAHLLVIVMQGAQGRHRDVTDPVEVLAAFGGFEIAMMVGVMLVAASKRHLIMVDGMAACAALLIASRIAESVTDYCVFCRSHGHHGLDQALALFHASALLELGMDSTDGTGATLAWPLVRSAAALLTEVADGEDPGPSRPSSMPAKTLRSSRSRPSIEPAWPAQCDRQRLRSALHRAVAAPPAASAVRRTTGAACGRRRRRAGGGAASAGGVGISGRPRRGHGPGGAKPRAARRAPAGARRRGSRQFEHQRLHHRRAGRATRAARARRCSTRSPSTTAPTRYGARRLAIDRDQRHAAVLEPRLTSGRHHADQAESGCRLRPAGVGVAAAGGRRAEQARQVAAQGHPSAAGCAWAGTASGGATAAPQNTALSATTAQITNADKRDSMRGL